MKKWNGRDASNGYQYPLSQVEKWNMVIDKNGTIYYQTQEENSKMKIWCTANKLTSHLHRILVQIPAR